MNFLRRLLLVLFLMCPMLGRAQFHEGKILVQAEMIADVTAVVPGKPIRLAAHLKLHPGWHVYSKDPGDSGIPTKIEWKLPAGFTAGELVWPEHLVIKEPGNIVVNAYHDKLVLGAPIQVPADIKEKEITFRAKVSWLVCEEICIPGDAEIELTLPVAQSAEPANTDLFPKTETRTGSSGGATSLWQNLLLGFLGGLILNVMPCVLPVIALKILGFVHQAGQSRGRSLRLGLAFTGGVFAFFLGLAALIAGLRAAGTELNWAFQFQNPWFVGGMAAVLLAFALSLLGLFEVALPAGMNNAVSRMGNSEGYGGTFLHGMFATLLATPCTAPFLGPALGYALGQSAGIIFVMFAAVAAGMSFPYLVLSAKPEWLRFIPKPGPWMIRFKQFMGVLLLVSAIWLGWVLWKQVGPQPVREPFQAQLDRALATGKTVFVDFTADWCVNCKVNEKLVLNTRTVQDALRENDVIFLVADWTRGDADITALLRKFERAGVPLYVIYPHNGGDPVVLPELLTTNLVREALNKIGRPSS